MWALLTSPTPTSHQPAFPPEILIGLTLLAGASLSPATGQTCTFVFYLQQDLVTKAVPPSQVVPALPCKWQRPHLTLQGSQSAQFPHRPPALDLGFSESASCTPILHPRWSMKGLRVHLVLPSPASSSLWMGAGRSPQRLRDLGTTVELGLGPGHPDSLSSALR